ncbi:MAG TPA: patatin-like phospholipase family protein [Gemmatirosa sp.]
MSRFARRRWSRRTLCHAVASALALAACSTTHRPAATVEALVAESAAERAADRAVRDTIVARLARRVAARGDRTLDLLFLSGGGQHGAYGVGFLRGWRARTGDATAPAMPRFDLVTGVSTGALQAPFAFVGTTPALDTLADLYRTAATSFAPTFDPWFWLRRTGGVVNTHHFEATIARVFDAGRRSALAADFGEGRQLLVATTDFDLGVGRVWDLQQAFGSGDSAGLARAQTVLYTSAAIPGIFPPRVIDGHVHADGGVISIVLTPLGLDDYRALAVQSGATEAAPVTVRVWTIANLWTHAPPAVLDPSSRRAMTARTTALQTFAQFPPLLERMAELARAVNTGVPGVRMEFHHTAVPAELSIEPGANKLFDAAWMRRLEAIGYARAQSTAPWDSVPSAYARPAPRVAAAGAAR